MRHASSEPNRGASAPVPTRPVVAPARDRPGAPVVPTPAALSFLAVCSALSLAMGCKQGISGTGGGPKPTPTQYQPVAGGTAVPLGTATVSQPVGTAGGSSTTAKSAPKVIYFPLKSHQGLCEGAGGGIGAYGAGRDGGARLHAACDVYNAIGTTIYAVTDGKVVQNAYPFYCSTDALEIDHGTFLVRYGEIKPGSAKVRAGQSVKAGQAIAQVGRLSCYYQPMLHFERFSGKASGALTTGGGKYQRRSDLENPTSFLKQILNNKPP